MNAENKDEFFLLNSGHETALFELFWISKIGSEQACLQ